MGVISSGTSAAGLLTQSALFRKSFRHRCSGSEAERIVVGQLKGNTSIRITTIISICSCVLTQNGLLRFVIGCNANYFGTLRVICFQINGIFTRSIRRIDNFFSWLKHQHTPCIQIYCCTTLLIGIEHAIERFFTHLSYFFIGKKI